MIITPISIQLANIAGLEALPNLAVLTLGEEVLEVISNAATGSKLVKFVDPNGKETRAYRIRRMSKLPYPPKLT